MIYGDLPLSGSCRELRASRLDRDSISDKEEREEGKLASRQNQMQKLHLGANLKLPEHLEYYIHTRAIGTWTLFPMRRRSDVKQMARYEQHLKRLGGLISNSICSAH
jgi:hypothetical protein